MAPEDIEVDTFISLWPLYIPLMSSLIKCVTQIDIGIGRVGIGRHQVHLTIYVGLELYMDMDMNVYVYSHSTRS